jgi:hypothetical protein
VGFSVDDRRNCDLLSFESTPTRPSIYEGSRSPLKHRQYYSESLYRKMVLLRLWVFGVFKKNPSHCSKFTAITAFASIRAGARGQQPAAPEPWCSGPSRLRPQHEVMNPRRRSFPVEKNVCELLTVITRLRRRDQEIGGYPRLCTTLREYPPPLHSFPYKVREQRIYYYNTTLTIARLPRNQIQGFHLVPRRNQH